ncbi:MAG: glycoside hydrolase family 3 C-terminal domain-containing protein, partial [Hyphomonadaceae bacterium]|nr:glycoside hydrolase family 3 C-terminal domain-containing protein [Hyphomonadaceae bacterium]
GQSVGLFGRLANLDNTGDNGSSKVRAPHVVTIAEGLGLPVSGDERDPIAAAEAAAQVDVAVIVAGTTAYEEGEFIPGNMGGDLGIEGAHEGAGALGGGGDRGGDRMRLRLPDDQVALINTVKAANPNTVVVLVCGSAIIPVEWMDGVGAILQTFYAGMQGGTALLRLLHGEVSPSGRLPFTLARDEADYPFFDKDADTITYGYWHGYSLMEKEGRTPLFGFGHGLSYTSFASDAVAWHEDDAGFEVSATITNTGGVAAETAALVFAHCPGVAVERPARLLRGFARVHLEPGQSRTITCHVPQDSLRYWDVASSDWRLETGPYSFSVVV